MGKKGFTLKIRDIAGRIPALLESVWIKTTYGFLALFTFFTITAKEVRCDFLDPVDQQVEIGGGKASLNKLGGIAGGLLIAAGIFILVSGVFGYIEAKGEDNSAGESKAARRIGVGLALIAGPELLNFIFN